MWGKNKAIFSTRQWKVSGRIWFLGNGLQFVSSFEHYLKIVYHRLLSGKMVINTRMAKGTVFIVLVQSFWKCVSLDIIINATKEHIRNENSQDLPWIAESECLGLGPSLHFFWCCCFGDWVWNQGLTLAKQALYCLSQTSSCFQCFDKL
jgi:hypothetical protein